MKRILCLVFAVLVCVSATAAAFAAGSEFVPSISYKDSPSIVPTKDPDGKDVMGVIIDNKADGKEIGYLAQDCLLVTPVSEAKDSVKIPADAREQLLAVYAGLRNGTMEIPYQTLNSQLKASEMVVRDLFDISLLCLEHPPMIAKEGVVLELTFDLKLPAGAEIYAATYSDGKWTGAVTCVNNGDGTVTCTFEDVGTVAFAVREATPPSQTGDTVGGNLPLWIGVMAASAVALVIVIMAGNRKRS